MPPDNFPATPVARLAYRAASTASREDIAVSTGTNRFKDAALICINKHGHGLKDIIRQTQARPPSSGYSAQIIPFSISNQDLALPSQWGPESHPLGDEGRVCCARPEWSPKFTMESVGADQNRWATFHKNQWTTFNQNGWPLSPEYVRERAVSQAGLDDRDAVNSGEQTMEAFRPERPASPHDPKWVWIPTDRSAMMFVIRESRIANVRCNLWFSNLKTWWYCSSWFR